MAKIAGRHDVAQAVFEKKSLRSDIGIGREYLYPCRYEADIWIQRFSSFSFSNTLIIIQNHNFNKAQIPYRIKTGRYLFFYLKMSMSQTKEFV